MDEILTKTGRRIPAPPKIRLSSNRVAKADCLKVDRWLVEQAIAEAESKHDDFVLFQFKQMKPTRLSQSDRDSANDYLFGETDPDVRKMIEEAKSG